MIELSLLSFVPMVEVLKNRDKQFKEKIRICYYKTKIEFERNKKKLEKIICKDLNFVLEWKDLFPCFKDKFSNNPVDFFKIYNIIGEKLINYFDYFMYFELKRYLDGWSLEGEYREYANYFEEFRIRKNFIIVNPTKSLEHHYDKLKQVKTYLNNINRSDLSFYRITCPYCSRTINSFENLKKTKKMHSIHCDNCGKRISISYKYGQYIWSCPNNFFKENLKNDIF